MRLVKKNIDESAIENATHYSKKEGQKHVKTAEDYTNDSGVEKRLSESLCKRCFYIRAVRIGGAAMTTPARFIPWK